MLLYYNMVLRAEVRRLHLPALLWTAICNEVNIPAILYNVPSRTGCGLQPQTVATLVKDVENIVGIKEASLDS